MNVRLISITPQAEKNLVYIARVSNPNNQENEEYAKLLRYCLEHQHWSVFEHAHMTLEIETSLAIGTQLLRHRSFTFQQFSARYANPLSVGLEFEHIHLRRQSAKNRQSSSEGFDEEEDIKMHAAIEYALSIAQLTYKSLLEMGVARECARMVLPQTTRTRIYMTGNIRSWIHYIQLRTQEDTQLEHREVALECRRIFRQEMPTIAEALQW